MPRKRLYMCNKRKLKLLGNSEHLSVGMRTSPVAVHPDTDCFTICCTRDVSIKRNKMKSWLCGLTQRHYSLYRRQSLSCTHTFFTPELLEDDTWASGRRHTKQTGNRNATAISENCYQHELNTCYWMEQHKLRKRQRSYNWQPNATEISEKCHQFQAGSWIPD
jgi:hypothetical protein